MKKIFLLMGMIISIMILHAYRNIDNKFSDILAQLGVTEETGKSSVWTSFLYQKLQYPSTNAIKTLDPSRKPEVVKDIAAYAKKYLLSDEFKKLYQQRREVEKPKDISDLKPQSAMKRTADAIAFQIEQEQNRLKTATDKTKPNIERSIANLQTRLKSYTDSSDKNYGANIKPYQQVYDMELVKYNTKMDAFNKQYPASPKDMIRSRLQYFLDLSADVDFNAELKTGPRGFKVFVNPDYENKSANWKMCFRAGKETILAVRREAVKFLSELK